MISKSKLGVLALVAMMDIGTAAFAQNLETGTAANTYGWNSPQADAISGRSNGLHAFARAPAFARTTHHIPRRSLRAYDYATQAPANLNPDEMRWGPDKAGAGSMGYNQHNEDKN
jgi:hypothetical protein